VRLAPVQVVPTAAERTSDVEILLATGDEFDILCHQGAPRSTQRAECRVLEVAPSGYYDWLAQPISNCAQEDARFASTDTGVVRSG
jgi:hypothetical protein